MAQFSDTLRPHRVHMAAILTTSSHSLFPATWGPVLGAGGISLWEPRLMIRKGSSSRDLQGVGSCIAELGLLLAG